MADDEIYAYAMKLLARREHSAVRLKQKLSRKFGEAPQSVIDRLVAKNFLNDRRYAESYAASRRRLGRARVQNDLEVRGIAPEIIHSVLSAMEWPSLRDAAKAKIDGLGLRVPLDRRDAGRLFRALQRLGYEEEAIREELETSYE